MSEKREGGSEAEELNCGPDQGSLKAMQRSQEKSTIQWQGEICFGDRPTLVTVEDGLAGGKNTS